MTDEKLLELALDARKNAYVPYSGYAVGAMGWAVNAKLMNGVTGTQLQPQGTATRAQVATMLMRFTDTIAK